MHEHEKATATAATVHRGGMGKNHRYYTALQEETQVVEIDFGLDTYAATKSGRKRTPDNEERIYMNFEI